MQLGAQGSCDSQDQQQLLAVACHWHDHPAEASVFIFAPPAMSLPQQLAPGAATPVTLPQLCYCEIAFNYNLNQYYWNFGQEPIRPMLRCAFYLLLSL